MKMLHFSSENAEKVHYARNILYNFKYSIHGIFLENNVAFTKASNYDLYIYLCIHPSNHSPICMSSLYLLATSSQIQ